MAALEQEFDVVVAGAGIVGASVALWTQADGNRVLLLDRQEPGSGASYGNACTIAKYACIPLNSPGIFRRLPGLLFGRNSPLRFDWWYALRHPGWQLSFLRHCSEARVEKIVEHLASLLQWVDSQGLIVTGDPVWARYNAPFTPWFMRRNEILLRIDS